MANDTEMCSKRPQLFDKLCWNVWPVTLKYLTKDIDMSGKWHCNVKQRSPRCLAKTTEIYGKWYWYVWQLTLQHSAAIPQSAPAKSSGLACTVCLAPAHVVLHSTSCWTQWTQWTLWTQSHISFPVHCWHVAAALLVKRPTPRLHMQWQCWRQ